jgi:glyoxylase-like metal-dependent hydrolase (beta-lactamase superfamily II)
MAAHAATPIARDTFLIPGAFPKDQQPDGNSIVLVAPEGLIVIDTGRHAAHTQKIADFAQQQKKPVAAIVNTHWHLDHIGGNASLREQYPALHMYASAALAEAQQGFLKNYRAQLEGAIQQAPPTRDVSAWRAEMQLIDAGARLAPDRTIEATAATSIAGRKLVVHLEKNAATAGDVWIEDPATRVVIAGDLVTLPVPFLDTACPAQWRTALEHLAEASFDTLIPGHGRPMSRKDFETYRTAFSGLLACAASEQPAAVCAEHWTKDTGSLIEPEDRDRVGSMIDYYLKAALRAPASALPKYCSA